MEACILWKVLHSVSFLLHAFCSLSVCPPSKCKSCSSLLLLLQVLPGARVVPAIIVSMFLTYTSARLFSSFWLRVGSYIAILSWALD